MKKIKIKIYLLSLFLFLVFILSLIFSFGLNNEYGMIDFIGLSSPSWKHIFGTDYLGRDLFFRTIAGGSISLSIGVFARITSMFVGILVGVCAGLANPQIKFILNTLTEVFLSIPSLLLAMALAVVFGEGYSTVIIAITVGTWAPVARFVAVTVREENKADYIMAEKALGAKKTKIIFRHLLPAVLPTLIPLFTTGIATSIMLESTLSFLGLAGSASASSIASWGALINEGMKFILDAPWLILPPAIILTLVVLAFNLLGDLIILQQASKIGNHKIQ